MTVDHISMAARVLAVAALVGIVVAVASAPLLVLARIMLG